MVARLAPVQKFACSNHVRVRQVLIFGHILAISLNNFSRSIEDDISSLSSVNKGKGTVQSKGLCQKFYTCPMLTEITSCSELL